MMAPQPIYDPPHVQLGRLMVVARRRGLTFAEFWTEAVREGLPLVMTNHREQPPNCVCWPTDRNDRRAWQHAIMATKGGWRRAYERREWLSKERALCMLGDSIGTLDTIAAERAEQELAEGIEPRAAVTCVA